jgi:hypothetical protein
MENKEVSRNSKIAVILLTCIILLQALAHIFLWIADYNGFVGDTYLRLYVASSWAKHPQLFIPGEYLPFYFYFYGTAIAIFGDIIWAGRIVTLAFSIGFIIFFYKVSMHILKNFFLALAAVILVQSSTLFLRVSTVPLSELPALFFIMASIYYLFEWYNLADSNQGLGNRGFFLLFLSQLLIFIANGLRYEAWLVSVLSTIFLATMVYKLKPSFWKLLLAAIMIVIPLLIPPIWLSIGKTLYGNPARFIPSATPETGGIIAILSDLAFYGKFILIYYPHLLILLIPVFFAGRSLVSTTKNKYMGVAAIVFLFFLILIELKFKQGHFVLPERTLLFFVAFISPLAILALRQLYEKLPYLSKLFKYGSAALLGIALLIACAKFTSLPPEPNLEAKNLGLTLKALKNSGWISQGQNLLVEKVPHAWHIVFTESNLKGRIFWDRKSVYTKPMNEPVSELPEMTKDELKATIDEAGIYYFVLKDPVLKEIIRKRFNISETIDLEGYSILKRLP